MSADEKTLEQQFAERRELSNPQDRIRAMREGVMPAPPPPQDPDEVLPGGLTRARYAELKRTNPFIAARYAAANLHNVTEKK